MGRLFMLKLSGEERIYCCRLCNMHLAYADDIESKAFHCRHGKAYLFTSVSNISEGLLEQRMMTTGMHTVSDIYCNGCLRIVGWKYEIAHEKSQKYKEGKFILERKKLQDLDGVDLVMTESGGGSDVEE